ncbi:family 78 glycoside hydrolase catalytic domain [Angustibacter sp. McL0619]|uniref:alpha-L-rhamnosidase n=1 Tax=Angustibacter sp. McL0619 TaxID=3415676 RepID=UPI003CF43615
MSQDPARPDRTDWTAQMVSPDEEFDGAPNLRQQFTLDAGHGPIARATLAITACGIFEAFINGVPVSADVLSPGWSSYEWRLRYREYDVSGLLDDDSVLAVQLGNGWFRGRLGFQGNRAFYGPELALLAQLDVTFEDGHTQRVGTDPTWQAGPSDTVANDLYDGQTIDARLRDETWKQPGAKLAGWAGVHPVEFDLGRLTAYVGPPVVRHETLRPTAVWTTASGRLLLDFGQNAVGWVRLRVQGERGHTVTVRHAEVLEHGELGTRPLRDAEATDRYVLSGGTDTFEPTKTFHGFRYAEIDGWPAGSSLADVDAVVVHSELKRTGHFESSDALLNRFHENVVWGLRGNFLDVPTDCPQRNERLGWTGDLSVFAPSATFLYDVRDFLRDWLLDLAAEQSHHEGMVPFVIPDILKYETLPAEFPTPDSTAVWSDAAVWVPWALWQAYGQLADLEDQYDSMTAHVRRVESLLSPNGLWDTGFQFGDWLDPQAPPDEPFKAKADNGVVATACFYRSASLVARTAELLGRTEDAASWHALAARTRAAFLQHYVRSDGTVLSDCATVYALAITFELLDGAALAAAGSRLAELVAQNDYRISTGFAGTAYVTDALTSTGHLDAAYRLLMERQCPSWLYPVTMGATTVWERWDSMLPDGSINPGEMTSFNHYALGGVADWIHRTVGGLAPLEPGYRRALIAPVPGGGLTWARTSLGTPHGQLQISWSVDDEGDLEVTAVVPDGVSALVRLPGEPDVEVGPGEHTFKAARAAA